MLPPGYGAGPWGGSKEIGMSAMGLVGGALATHLWKRLAALALALASVAAIGLLTTTPPAHAQETCNPGPSEPYSGGQPPCVLANQITLDVSPDEGNCSSLAEVSAKGFTVGDPVSIGFGGQQVATATATPSDDPAFSGKGAIREDISVPCVEAGTYDVCVSAPNAQTACSAFRVNETARVLGVRFSNDGAGGAGGAGGFARTGITLLAYLIAAVILILIGRFLVAKTRSRGAVDHRG